MCNATNLINFGESYLVPSQRRLTLESRTSSLANDDQRFASGFQEVEVVDETIWVLGGDGFGTERARLVGDALGTERARLAQGGFRGKFYKRNPFKRFSENTKNFAKFSLTEDPILLGTKFKKSRSP